MKIPPKPPVPEEVYESSVLLYTIVDYHWIPPGDKKLTLILKPGWFPIKRYNFDHPLMKKQLQELHEEQEKSLKNKEVNWDRLSRMYITI